MKDFESINEQIQTKEFLNQVFSDNKSDLEYYNNQLGFADLKSRIGEMRNPSQAELFDLCEEFFSEDLVNAVIRRERDACSKNAYYGSNFQPIDGSFFTGIVLATTDDFTAMVLALNGNEIETAKHREEGDVRTISFAGTPSFLKFYKGRGVSLKIWEIDEFDDHSDLAKEAPKPRLTQTLEGADGRSYRFKANESFEYVAEAGANALLLQVQMHNAGAPLALEFDYDDGHLVGASSPDQEPTRLQMLTTALRIFGRTDAFEQMVELLEYPSHFVRWHAMRECIGLDSQRALPHLLKMSKTDPQPSVRRAAVATLNQFYSEELSALAS